MAKVLVTGGAGFLGAEIVRALAARGDTPIAFDVSAGDEPEAFEAGHPGARAVAGDITDRARIEEVVGAEAPDAVVHCAALVGVPASVSAPQETMRTNVEGALNLMEAMRLGGTRRLLHMSTEEVYGPFTTDPIPEDHPCSNPIPPARPSA